MRILLSNPNFFRLKPIFILFLVITSFPVLAQVCYNNATPSDADSGILGFVTDRDPDKGCRGLAISQLQLDGLNMTSFGFGARAKNNRSIADDFTLTTTQTLATVKLYPYKNNIKGTTTTTQILEEAYIRIWNGKPGAPGSLVVHGDLTTNVLVSSVFTGIYRVNDINDTYCERPIMEVTADLGCKTLNAGTYWLEWQFVVKVDRADFSAIYKSVPLTEIGKATTGDALISSDGGVTYAPVVDEGLRTAQGFPFIIDCKALPAPVPTMGQWGIMCLSLLLLIVGTKSIQQFQLDAHPIQERV